MNAIKETIGSVFNWIDVEEDHDMKYLKFFFVGFISFLLIIFSTIIITSAIGGVVDIIQAIMNGIANSIHGGIIG